MSRQWSAIAPVAAVLIAVGFALTGCTVTQNSFPPSASAPPVETFGAPDPDATAPPPIAIDPSLLSNLPGTVESIPIIQSDEGNSALLADDVAPTIGTSAVAFEAADTQTSDLVFGLVVKLIPNAFTDDLFRDWRDSYDAGACSGDSQVVGQAEADVDGNHVFIGTCATGLRTYHTWLKDKGILISSSSTGEKRLGLVLLGNLPK